MRRIIIKGVLAAVIAGFCFATPLRAQNREKAWELYPYLGYVKFASKVGLDDSPSLGLNFAYHWTKRHEVEFGFGGTSTNDTASGKFSADLITARVNYVYNIFLHRRDKIVAFVTAGAGVLDFSTFGFTTNPKLVGDEQDFMYNYGVGVRFFGGERAGLRLDARKVDYSKKGGGGSQNYLEVTLGVTLVLGGA